MVDKFRFPEKTIEWMVDRTRGCNSHLHDKLLEAMKLKDFNKMNRWFGYYQRLGEDEGYWTLDEIIEMVRNEKKEFKNKNKRSTPEHICPKCHLFIGKYIPENSDIGNVGVCSCGLDERIAKLGEKMGKGRKSSNGNIIGTGISSRGQESSKPPSTPQNLKVEKLERTIERLMLIITEIVVHTCENCKFISDQRTIVASNETITILKEEGQSWSFCTSPKREKDRDFKFYKCRDEPDMCPYWEFTTDERG